MGGREDARNGRARFDDVEIEIYLAGPPLYDADDRVVGRPVDRVHDTTGQSGGLPVMHDGVRIGTALSMVRDLHEGNVVLIYRCRLRLREAELSALRTPDGLLWTCRAEAAMWLSGIYPTHLHLTPNGDR